MHGLQGGVCKPQPLSGQSILHADLLASSGRAATVEHVMLQDISWRVMTVHADLEE